MMMKNLLFAVALLSVALWTGCATGGSGHTKGIQVTVASAGNAVVVGVTLTLQFTATALPDAAPQTFNWSLACDAGANLCGTLDANGLYTAPSAIPNPATAHVTATSTIDATGFDTADITIVKSRLAASSTYAFHFSGFDSGNAAIAVAGNFATDVNGAIV